MRLSEGTRRVNGIQAYLRSASFVIRRCWADIIIHSIVIACLLPPATGAVLFIAFFAHTLSVDRWVAEDRFCRKDWRELCVPAVRWYDSQFRF